jgi:hypothetical protein
MRQNRRTAMPQNPTILFSQTRPSSTTCRYSILLWILTILFVARVACQALQNWWPQTWLPGLDRFQGSNLPYFALLGAQILIIILMVYVCLRVQQRTFSATHRTTKVLTWFGGIYLLGSVLRIGVGLLVPTAPAWFSTWIPATFHLVLAGYVLTLALHSFTLLDQ